MKPGVVTQTCNPSTQEMATGHQEFKVALVYKVSLKPISAR